MNTQADFMHPERITSSKATEATESRRTAGTGSRTSFWLGVVTSIGVAGLAALGFFVVPADDVQGDAVRIMFVHVPSAVGAYLAFGLTLLGSIMWLTRKSEWWDILAHSAAEVGTLLCGLAIVTGMLWGRPTWGTYWEWGDVRLMTTLILFLIMVGYLVSRSAFGTADPVSTATKAAVIGIAGAANIPIVHKSVDWWADRTLHQPSSLTDGKIEDLTLLTLMFGFLVVGLFLCWALIHRFRLGWLERELYAEELSEALHARRLEAAEEDRSRS
ncbi:MAG: cytochrome c biogenesis protein CcsA [Acidimicrobiaceae bacterium]|nr:cytochrome c biogenesis protein CcsA [Acidimicrobiaceae bacterium]